ncbi:hypothetical protein [Mucilaginibacter mali]|uniref:hypothetical protein n=1 Tax=Mucilaginibacter mali TaxID=2740462 RepID=UPI001F2078AE|nr:hypothetical protein [Mucilaginibacter mali]
MQFTDPDGMAPFSTHTDAQGNVLAVYNDGDLGVYKHINAHTKEDIDKDRSPRIDGSHGGEKMGETLMWDSFVNGQGQPAGNIRFNSNAAELWLTTFEGKMREVQGDIGNYMGRMHYAMNAGNKDEYDFKTQNGNGIYGGSQISKGIYVSARDVGNFAAGRAAAMTGQDKMDFLLTAGGFNLSGNSKYQIVRHTSYWQDQARKAGYPAFGEAPRSDFFQRMGYENITTKQSMITNYKKIWDIK